VRIGIKNFAPVTIGIFRGAQPRDDDWQQLVDLGITHVVKLNTAKEGSDEAAVQAGLIVDAYPINIWQQILLEPPESVVKAAVAALKPGTFVHCTHGQDRTGLIVGCFRRLNGWSKSDAYAEMIDHGFHPELIGLDLYWVNH